MSLWEKTVTFEKIGNPLTDLGIDYINATKGTNTITYREFYDTFIKNLPAFVDFFKNATHNSGFLSYVQNKSSINSIARKINKHNIDYSKPEDTVNEIIDVVIRVLLNNKNVKGIKKDVESVINEMVREGIVDKFAEDYIKEYYSIATAPGKSEDALSTLIRGIAPFFSLSVDFFLAGKVFVDYNQSYVPMGAKKEILGAFTEDTPEKFPAEYLIPPVFVVGEFIRVWFPKGSKHPQLQELANVFEKGGNAVVLVPGKMKEFVSSDTHELLRTLDKINIEDLIVEVGNFISEVDANYGEIHVFEVRNQEMFYDVIHVPNLISKIRNIDSKNRRTLVTFLVKRYLLGRHPSLLLEFGRATEDAIETLFKFTGIGGADPKKLAGIIAKYEDIIRDDKTFKKLRKEALKNDFERTFGVDAYLIKALGKEYGEFFSEMAKVKREERNSIKHALFRDVSPVRDIKLYLKVKTEKMLNSRKKKKKGESKNRVGIGITNYDTVEDRIELIKKLTEEGVIGEKWFKGSVRDFRKKLNAVKNHVKDVAEHPEKYREMKESKKKRLENRFHFKLAEADRILEDLNRLLSTDWKTLVIALRLMNL